MGQFVWRFTINELNIKSNNYNDIKSKIINWVENEIKNKNLIFNLTYGKDYFIENIDNPKFLKSLVAKKGKNSLTLKIKPNPENFDGEAKFTVNNEYDGKLTTEDKNSWKAKRKLRLVHHTKWVLTIFLQMVWIKLQIWKLKIHIPI